MKKTIIAFTLVGVFVSMIILTSDIVFRHGPIAQPLHYEILEILASPFFVAGVWLCDSFGKPGVLSKDICEHSVITPILIATIGIASYTLLGIIITAILKVIKDFRRIT